MPHSLVLAPDHVATKLPNDAVCPMAAVECRVAAGDAGLQAMLTVAVFKLVTEDLGGSVRVKTAFLLVVAHTDKSQVKTVSSRYCGNEPNFFRDSSLPHASPQ